MSQPGRSVYKTTETSVMAYLVTRTRWKLLYDDQEKHRSMFVYTGSGYLCPIGRLFKTRPQQGAL